MASSAASLVCVLKRQKAVFDYTSLGFFQRDVASLYRVKQSFSLINRVVGKMFTLARISDFALEQNLFRLQSLIKPYLQGFCSMCHALLLHHEFKQFISDYGQFG